MSKTVDERVVSMQFDNAQFERNVATSMSTLDKLKAKLNFGGAAKGLDGISAASKKVDFSGMSKGIDTVQAKFSAMQVVGTTALVRITNSAITAGERMIKALTIDPVKTGFSEYETQINAIQTILANTQKEGTNVATVNKALDELNLYADKTIYNFTEMTRNIGTFTAAGVKLNDSVSAIKGIANLAAMSGSTSQQASTAMYQLSQALAAGTVKLMDWNSVVNAGMGGQLFQDALKRTATQMGYNVDALIEKYGSFRESLSRGEWLTAEVLTETLAQLAGAYTEADLIQQGYSKSQAKEIVQMAKTAEDAATKVKTFTQLWDTMKEAAQSGWAQAWRSIVGDFEEAKELLTGISDFFTGDAGLIAKMNDTINGLIGGAMGKTFSSLSEKFSKIAEPAKKVSESVTKVSTSLEDLGKIADRVILGEFGNMEPRFKKLTEMGYNWMEVQNEVNKKLGNSHRYTKEQIAAQDKLIGSQKKTTKSTKEVDSETKKLTDDQKKLIKQYAKLTDEQMKEQGFTEEQVAAYKELRDTAKQLGVPLDTFIDKMDEINGRWILWNSFENIGKSILKVFSSIGDALRDVFEPITSDQLFNAIAAFSRFTSYLIMSDETAQKLTNTFRGLFSVIHIITTIAGGGFSLAFRVLSEVLKRFDTNILDLTSGIGNALTRLDQFITKNKLVSTAIDFIADAIVKAIEAVDKFVDSLINQPAIQEFMDMMKTMFGGIFGDLDDEAPENLSGGLRDLNGALEESSGAAENFKTIFEGLNAVLDLGNYFITKSLTSGIKLLNAVLASFGTDLGDVLSKLADYVVQFRDWVKENTIFVDAFDKLGQIIGVVISGISGVVSAFSKLDFVKNTIKRFSDLIKDFFGSFGEGFNISFVDALITQIESVFDRISKWVESLNNSDHLGLDLVLGLANGIREGIGVAVSSIASIAQAVIETFCGLLGIHSPSTVAFGWGKNIVEGLVNGIKSVIGLATEGVGSLGLAIVNALKTVVPMIFDGLEYIVDAFRQFFEWIDLEKIISAIPIVIVLVFVKKLYDTVKILENGIKSINSVLDGVGGVLNGLKNIENAYAKNLKAKAFRNIALSLAILIGAVALLTFVDQDKLYGAVVIVGVLAGILVALAFAMDKLSNASASFDKGKLNIDGIKSGLISIGVVLLLLAVTVRLMGTMDPEQAKQGFLGLAGLVTAVAAVFLAFGILAKANATGDIDKVGGMLIKLSIAMLLMVAVCKLAGKLDENEMIKGAGFAAAFTVFVLALTAVSKLAGQHVDKIGGMILKLSIAMLLLVGVCKLVGMLETSEMLKGAAFAAGFTVFVAALVLVSKMFPQAQIQKVSGLVLSMSFSLLLMVAVCKLVGLLTPSDMIKGAAFVAGFIVLIGLLVKVTAIASDKQIAKVSATILAMSIAIGVLAAVSILLSMMSLEGLLKGVTAVSILGLVMTAMIAATKGANNVKGNLITMTVAIAIMAGAVILLSTIDPSKLAGATAALSILMGMFAVMTKVASTAKSAIKNIAVMTFAIGLIAGMIYLLSGLPVENVIGSAIALSALMLAMSGVLVILNKFAGSSAKSLVGVLALTSLAIPLLAFVGILALAQNVDASMNTVKTLVLFVGALTLLLIPLTIIGSFAVAALAGVLALTAMAVPLLAFVGILALMNNIENASANAEILTDLMTTFGEVLTKISLVAPLALMAVAAITGLTLVIGAVGILAVAVGALMEKFPGIQNFLDTGIPVLEKLAYAVGSILGNLVTGFATPVISLLPALGMALSAFMVGAQPFIAMASTIDGSVLAGVGFLSGAILALSAANFISAISQFLSFGQSFAELGTQLSQFISNAQPFLTGIKSIDPSAVEAAGVLASLVLKLSAADLLSGISNLFSWFTGGNSFADLGAQLSSFAEAMVDFSNTISGANIDPVAIDTFVSAAAKLIDLQSSLEPMGGVVQWFMGEKDFTSFGEGIVAFGKAMKDFSESISGITLDEAAFSAVVSAGTKLAELQSSLEKMGGVLQFFTGDKDFESFGEGIVAFGKAMKDFSESISGVTLDEATLGTVIAAGGKLAELQSSLEKMDGVIQWFTGDRDFTTFGEGITAFGNAMRSLSSSVGEGFNEEAVSMVIRAGEKLSELQESLPEEGWFDGKISMAEFSTYIKNFGTAMASFGTSVSEINTEGMDAAINAANRIKTLITSLGDLDVSGVEAFVGGGFSTGAVSKIGTAIASFANSVGEVDTEVLSSSITAANRLKTFVASLAGLDPSGIENFKIGSIGTNLKSYADKVSGMDPGIVLTSITAANRLKTFITGLAGLDSSGISNFKVGSIGSSLANYSASIAGFDAGAVTSSVTAATKLKNFISSLTGLDTSGVSSFITAINQLGKVSIDGIVKSFSGASTKMLSAGSNLIESVAKGMKSKQSSLTSTVTGMLNSIIKPIDDAKSKFTTAGTQLITNLVKGMNEKGSAVKSAARSIAASGETGARTGYSGMESAGKYLGAGLVSGINAKKTAAYNAGYALGQAAVRGEKDGQASNSPSKLTIQAGKWLGEGLVIGIEKMGTKVYNAGHNLGDSAASSMSRSISKVAEMINSDVDAQPTIRPVLDLDDVKSGMGLLDGLLTRDSMVGVSANLSSISYGMNRLGARTELDDVVDAVNKLRKDLSNTGGDTYNINGITYDDGSNVTEAVKTLVRASRIERRI